MGRCRWGRGWDQGGLCFDLIKPTSTTTFFRFWESDCLLVLFVWVGMGSVGYLTLNVPNKNCSRRHFNFLLLSFHEK